MPAAAVTDRNRRRTPPTTAAPAMSTRFASARSSTSPRCARFSTPTRPIPTIPRPTASHSG